MLVFIIVCYILLPIMNLDYLFALQEHSLWVKGRTFMMDTVADRGGWISYIACYLTQYFYYPWLGSTFLIALWVVIYYLLNKAFNLTDAWSFIPLLILTFFPIQVLSLGYWLYISKCPGFAFIPTLYACIIAVFILCVSFMISFIKNDNIRKYKAVLLVPIFIVILSSFCKSFAKYDQFAVTLNDVNFKHELRMYKAVEECRWEDVIKEAPKQLDAKHKKPTSLMVLFNTIALLNTNQLIETIFTYDNCGTLPAKYDDTKITIAKQAGPLLYYYYGLVNYSYRWAIGNSVKYYPQVDNLKMLTRCAIFNQEFDVAMKYINILKNTTFYRSWALEQQSMIMDSRKYMETAEYNYVSPLVDVQDELDTDNSNIFDYILDHFSNFNTSAYPKEELSIVASLLLQHEEEFMIHFYNFTQNHPQAAMPTSMQEAAYLIGPTDLSPIDISQYPFDMNVKTSFAQFNEDYNINKSMRMSDKESANKMKAIHGTTYWWYYYFYSKLVQY